MLGFAGSFWGQVAVGGEFLNELLELFGFECAFDGVFVGGVHPACDGFGSEDVVGVVVEVLVDVCGFVLLSIAASSLISPVDGDSFWRGVEVVWIGDGFGCFLEDEEVGDDAGGGEVFEGGVGQSVGGEEVHAALGERVAGGIVLFIEGVA